MLKSELLVSQNVTFMQVIEVRSLGWALTQYNWCSYLKEKEKSDFNTETHVEGRQCEETERRWPSMSQVREAWNRSYPTSPWEEPTVPAP